MSKDGEHSEGAMRRVVSEHLRESIADQVQEFLPTRADALKMAVALVIDGNLAVDARAALLRARQLEMGANPSKGEHMALLAHGLWLKGLETVGDGLKMDPLMLAGFMVESSYGVSSHRFQEWLTPKTFDLFLNPAKGQECLMLADPGTGKTHLKILFIEAAVGFGYHVIHNIGTLRTDLDSKRVHYASMFSDVLKVAVKLAGEKVLFFWDEPSNSMDAGDAGRSESKHYNKARSVIRKFGLATLYGFQHDGQVSTRLMQGNSGSMIRKRNKSTVTVTYPTGEGTKKVTLTEVPALACSSYDDKALATLPMDVDMEVLAQATLKLRTVAEQHKAIQEALRRPETYLEKYWPHHGFDKDAKKAAQEAKREAAKEKSLWMKDLVALIKKNPGEYATATGKIDRQLVYDAHGPKSGGEISLTWDEARLVAAKCNA